MFRKFSLLLAMVFALSVGIAQAQTFTYLASNTWQLNTSWTAMTPATGFPGQTANNGDVTIGGSPTFTDGPNNNISSLTLSGGANVTLGGSSLFISGALNVPVGTTLIIPAGVTVDVTGPTTVGGTINLNAATSRLRINGTLTGSGSITAVATSVVQFAASVTSIPGTLFPTFNGTLQTLGNIALTSNLTTGVNGVLTLGGTMTINSGVSFINGNTSAGGGIAGAGNIQGASATSIVDLTAAGGATPIIQGTWFANPFNGRLNTPTLAATLAAGTTLTMGSSGLLNIGAGGLTLTGISNLILNNTATNSLAGTGTIIVPATSSVTLGPGFNGGTIPGDRFGTILGNFNTGGNLTISGAAVPILNIGATGVLNLTGTLTIGAGNRIDIANTAMGAISGSGTFAAAGQTSSVRLLAGANGATGVPGANFSNPWLGTLETLDARNLTGNMTIGPAALLVLGGDLTVAGASDVLTLNQTSAVTPAITGTGVILAGTATSVVEIGDGAYGGNLPTTKLGTASVWAPGILRILGNSVANAVFTIGATGVLNLPANAALRVAPAVTLTINGQISGTGGMSPQVGRINGVDNTATVVLGTLGTFNQTGFGTGTDLPGRVFGKVSGDRAFDGNLSVGGTNRILNTSLIMGPNSILTLNAANTLTVNSSMTRTDTLSLNMTAAILAAIPGAAANQILGNGVVNFGNGSLFGTYPAALPLVSNTFTGRIIVGDNVNFAANYTTPAGAIMQFNGVSTVNNATTLTFANTFANTITGTGTLQGQTASGTVAFVAGANNGIIPGASFFGTPNTLSSAFNGRIETAGPMTLTGNLNMGPASNMRIGTALLHDLTISPTSRLLLQQTGSDAAAFPQTAPPAAPVASLGKLVGQPSSGNVPEIILATNAFSSQLLPTSRLTLGSAGTDFGGRLTIGSGFAVTAPPFATTLTGTTVGGTPFTVNSPAILNIVSGAVLNVNAGAGIRLNSTANPATGPGLGRIQGVSNPLVANNSNTAIVQIGNNFNGGTLPGNLLGAGTPNPRFDGALVLDAAGNLNPGVTMSSVSLLVLNGTSLVVSPSAELRLEGGVNTVQGTGVLSGSNSQSRITLASGFNGGTLPTARFVSPVSANLTTEGPMTLDGSFSMGVLSTLNLGGNMTVPATGILTLSQTGINSFGTTNNAAFVGSASSRIVVGGNFNNRLLPGPAFSNFAGLISLNSPMSLTSGTLTLGATSQLDLGGNGNCLALGPNGLSVINPVQGTSATTFIVTNGLGAMTINNSALGSVFFPIGTTNASYTPLSMRSTSGTADIFTARVRVADPLTNGISNFLGYVNREWIVSAASPTVVRGVTFAPQWNTDNQRGTFLSFSAGVAAFVSTTSQYLESSTSATTPTANGGFTVIGNLPPIGYTNIPVVVFSRRPVFNPPPTNPVTINAFSPSSFPASNDPFTVTFFGLNLGSPDNRITLRNNVSGAQASPTTTSSVGINLSVTLPGGLRSVPGTVTISITNANTSFTSAIITITPVTSPTITAIAPTTTASGSPFALTIRGTGFFANAIVTLNNGGVRSLTATTGTTAVVEVPARINATSNTVRVRISNSDGQFAEANYVIGQATRPVITTVSPRAVFANSGDTQITVNGTGFFGQGNISAFFGSALIPVRFVSSTQVVITVPASLLTTVGNPSIIISNSDAQNIGYVFSVQERVPLGPTPAITTVTPTVTTASFRAFSVNITGQNFNPAALVTVLGQFVPVTRTGTTGLAVEIPAGLNTTTNTYEIVIQNPDLQFTSANVRIGDRLNAPTIGTVSPLTTVATLQPRPFTITISGTNFTQDVQVLYGGVPVQIVSVSATSIVAIIPNNNAGMFPLIVLNGDGQGTTPITFNVISKVTEQTLPNVSVYPSPVTENMTISAGFATPVTVRVTITNVVGQRVMSFTEQASGVYNRNVNMSDLPTGAYIVEVSDGARRLVQKIVKY
jgi:hypothetical protein